MVRNSLIALAVILLALVGGWMAEREMRPTSEAFYILEQGKEIPDFQFKTVSGQTHSFYDFKGYRQVIVHFWATWCPPCLVELPALMAFAKSNKDVTVLAISSDKNVASVQRFFDKADLIPSDNFLVILDADKEITKGRFSVFRLPESFLFEKDLTLTRHIIGVNEDW